MEIKKRRTKNENRKLNDSQMNIRENVPIKQDFTLILRISVSEFLLRWGDCEI